LIHLTPIKFLLREAIAMMIFDFITQEEMDELPDDDPRAAFVTWPQRNAKRTSAFTGVAGDGRPICRSPAATV
jgi:hypothetical protein